LAASGFSTFNLDHWSWNGTNPSTSFYMKGSHWAVVVEYYSTTTATAWVWSPMVAGKHTFYTRPLLPNYHHHHKCMGDGGQSSYLGLV